MFLIGMKRGKMMKKLLFLSIASMMLIVLAACGSDGDQSGDTFEVGIIPALSGDEFQDGIAELEKVLDEALPQDVEITIYPNYNGVVEALNVGHIQMAYLGPRTYVEANNQSGAEAIVTQLIDGEPSYHSYIITHADNPWDTLDEFLENVEERTFAFGSVSSTSGSLVPAKELRDRGVFEHEEEHQFDAIRFSGSHDLTGQEVQNNNIDAGAIDSAFFNNLVAQGLLDDSVIKVIWQSEPLFQYPWAVHPDVDQETIELLQETFIAIDNPAILEGAFGATGFTEATNADYDLVLQLMIEAGDIKID